MKVVRTNVRLMYGKAIDTIDYTKESGRSNALLERLNQRMRDEGNLVN